MKFKRFISLVLVAIMLFTVPVFANEEPDPEPTPVSNSELSKPNGELDEFNAIANAIGLDSYENVADDAKEEWKSAVFSSAKELQNSSSEEAQAIRASGEQFVDYLKVLEEAYDEYKYGVPKTDEERYQEARGEEPVAPPAMPPIPSEGIEMPDLNQGVLSIGDTKYTVVYDEGKFVLTDDGGEKYTNYLDITGDEESPVSEYVDSFIKNVEYKALSNFYNNFPSQEEWLNNNPSARVKYEQALSNYNTALANLRSALNAYFNPTPDDDPPGGEDPLPTIVQAVVDAYNNLVETVKSYFVEASSDYVTINAMASNFKFNVYQTDLGFKNEVDKFIKDFQLRYYSASPKTQKAFDELYVLWLFAQ